MRLRQAGGDGAQGAGIAQTIRHGVVYLGADKGKVVPHGDKMQPLAGSVEQQHQRSGTCQQRAVRFGLGDEQHKALHQCAQGGQDGKAVRRGGLGKARKTGHKGAPVGGTGSCQQRQRHTGID